MGIFPRWAARRHRRVEETRRTSRKPEPHPQCPQIYWKLAKSGHSFALVKLSASYERAGASAEAEKLAAAYELAAPESANAGWSAVANARYERGDTEGAERLLWELVEDGNEGVLRDIADLRLKTGDKSGAEETLRLAVNSGLQYAKESLAKLEQTNAAADTPLSAMEASSE